jgi:RNA polymerase sigma-70 factor (ECF subfamily)
LFNVSDLGRKASNGDRFDAVVRPHFDALYKAARRMMPSPHDAEDLVQDVCITAYERLDELECVEYPRAWLLKVLYHRFIDSRRRGSRSPIDIAPSGIESPEPYLYPAGAAGPEELVDRDQRVQQVLRAMRCLNAEHCALVAMHDVEGVSIEELCRMTGMPSGTIKAQLHRTRIKLGRLLSNEALARPRLKVIGGVQ